MYIAPQKPTPASVSFDADAADVGFHADRGAQQIAEKQPGQMAERQQRGSVDDHESSPSLFVTALERSREPIAARRSVRKPSPAAVRRGPVRRRADAFSGGRWDDAVSGRTPDAVD